MARRGGGLFMAIVRDMERASRRAAADARRYERERLRQLREAERYERQAAREAKQEYIASRIDEVEDSNAELNDTIAELESILADGLSVPPKNVLTSLRMKEDFRPFNPPHSIAKAKPAPDKGTLLARVKAPNRISRAIPGILPRYERALERARNEYETLAKQWLHEEQTRLARLEELQVAYNSERETFLITVRQRNAEIDELENEYSSGQPEAISSIIQMALEVSNYPDDFPQEHRVGFSPESKQCVIDYHLPGTEVIPLVAEYRYVKARDAIDERPRKAQEVKDRYLDVIASICLRTIWEVLAADHKEKIEQVVFNGFTRCLDPATGKEIQPYLISVRATREQFSQLELRKVDKRACLRNLGAQVSAHPSERQAVKPIVDINMVDRRFVVEDDVLSSLDDRQNLMDLNPFEFEHLVCNLFDKMGLEAKLTRSSRDGGVDVVAFDARPVLGGKVVIQAKRYRHVVGVSAVRDLFGTMVNEGANKGILVTTSGYGSDAFQFAKDKPIELIDGGGLLFLLQENGVNARIVFPQDNQSSVT